MNTEQGNIKRGEKWFPKNYKIILIIFRSESFSIRTYKGITPISELVLLRGGLPSDIALQEGSLVSKIVYQGVVADFGKPKKYFRITRDRVKEAIYIKDVHKILPFPLRPQNLAFYRPKLTQASAFANPPETWRKVVSKKLRKNVDLENFRSESFSKGRAPASELVLLKGGLPSEIALQGGSLESKIFLSLQHINAYLSV